MKKLIVTMLSALALTVTTEVPAMHAEYYIDENGVSCTRLVEDEWDKGPLPPVTAEEIRRDQIERETTNLEDLTITKTETGYEIRDDAKMKLWVCRD